MGLPDAACEKHQRKRFQPLDHPPENSSKIVHVKKKILKKFPISSLRFLGIMMRQAHC